MKTLKLIQIILVACSMSACSKTKSRTNTAAKNSPNMEKNNRDSGPINELAVIRCDKSKANCDKEDSSKKDVDNKVSLLPVSGSETKQNQLSAPQDLAPPINLLKATFDKADVSPNNQENEVNPAKLPSEALDSAEIKSGTQIPKLSFKNLEGLKKIMMEKNKVLFQSESVDKEAALKKLIVGNEDHFCSVSGLDKFNKADFLKLTDTKSDKIDRENDIYKSILAFENKNGRLEFECTHTNENIFMEDMRINFKNFLSFYDAKGGVENSSSYINPFTRMRLKNAFKLVDIETIMKVKFDEKAEKGFALVNGKLLDADQATTAVNEGKAQHSCMLMNVKGQLDGQKIYAPARKPSVVKAKEGEKTLMVSYAFRADRESGFLFFCFQTAVSTFDEINKALGGFVKNGMLERNEYYKKTIELAQYQAELLEKSKENEK